MSAEQWMKQQQQQQQATDQFNKTVITWRTHARTCNPVDGPGFDASEIYHRSTMLLQLDVTALQPRLEGPSAV